jgi:hypothetical protein
VTCDSSRLFCFVTFVSLDKLLPVFDEHGRHVAPVTDWSMIVDDPARQTELRIVLRTAIVYVCALIADRPRAIDRYIDYYVSRLR